MMFCNKCNWLSILQDNSQRLTRHTCASAAGHRATTAHRLINNSSAQIELNVDVVLTAFRTNVEMVMNIIDYP